MPIPYPIASIGVSNTMAVLIYDFQFGTDTLVLAGFAGETPHWHRLSGEDETMFFIGKMKFDLTEAMRF